MKEQLFDRLTFCYTYYRKSYLNAFSLFILTKIVNNIMSSGKKDKALKVLYSLIFNIRLTSKTDPIKVILTAILRIKPVVRLKRKKIAGKNLFIPLYLDYSRQLTLSSKLIVASANLYSTGSISFKLLSEINLINTNLLDSITYKKRQEIYKIALENKYYMRYL